MKSPADKLDLDLLRAQDPAEFTRMVREHEAFVMSLCRSMGLSAADRDDAAAETFALAYRSLPQFRGEAALATWLYRIAWRTAVKVRRRVAATAPVVDDPADAGAGPDDTAAGRETYEAIWRAVARLEPEQAAAVEMFYRRGMAIQEIASVMEKPEGTIKTLLFRSRERLRHLLQHLQEIS